MKMRQYEKLLKTPIRRSPFSLFPTITSENIKYITRAVINPDAIARQMLICHFISFTHGDNLLTIQSNVQYRIWNVECGSQTCTMYIHCTYDANENEKVISIFVNFSTFSF